MDSFFSVICSFVSCINFSLSFRNFRFVPRSCLASLKWKAVLLSAEQNRVLIITSWAKSFIFSAKLSLDPSGCLGPLIFLSCCSCCILVLGSLRGPAVSRPCIVLYNHPHWPVDLLGADDGGGVAGGHVAHLQLAQGRPGQQSLRRADEGLGTDVGVRLRRYKRLDQQLTLGSSCGFSKFSWLKLLSLSSWSSSSSTLFTTSSISSSLYSNLDTETSSAMKDTFLLLVGVSDLGLLLPEDKTTW